MPKPTGSSRSSVNRANRSTACGKQHRQRVVRGGCRYSGHRCRRNRGRAPDRDPALPRGCRRRADWVRLTQSQFDPIRISSRLWIIPTWQYPARPHRDQPHSRPRSGLRHRQPPHYPPLPAMAGTEYPRWRVRAGLRLRLGHPGDCGAEVGAGACWVVDIDPQAVLASRQNAEQNQAKAEFYLPDEGPENPG